MSDSHEELLRQADTAGALARLQGEVRARPDDAKLRVALFQLLCVLGQWERAATQLKLCADLEAKAIAMREVYLPAVESEALRARVFAGDKTPMVMGQPEPWLALLIESMLRNRRGEVGEARRLREQAFEQAPVSRGRIDGQPFEWLADADMRLGPVLEAVINGRYYWVPFARLSRIALEEPSDLRDCVWMPAHLWFDNGGETMALIPTRYPGSEVSADGLIQLARKTEWVEPEPGVYVGLGQRVLATDGAEHSLMDVRAVEFDAAAS